MHFITITAFKDFHSQPRIETFCGIRCMYCTFTCIFSRYCYSSLSYKNEAKKSMQNKTDSVGFVVNDVCSNVHWGTPGKATSIIPLRQVGVNVEVCTNPYFILLEEKKIMLVIMSASQWFLESNEKLNCQSNHCLPFKNSLSCSSFFLFSFSLLYINQLYEVIFFFLLLVCSMLFFSFVFRV